ncbi:MAG: lipopolysaccharide biosynthesis protein [Alphaproteobacteria bacterium]|nr:lipopolysaccharide biosynthesis protein [Alphaproteobacteria bacterium]
MSLRKIAFGSALLSSVGVIRLLAQFFVVPLLSRLLEPQDYGLIAMAMPFVLFTMIFSDAGLGQSLIRHKQRDRMLWSTCFWLSFGIGGAFSLGVALMAYPSALFFGEPELLAVLLALAPVAAAQAACSIPQAAMQQEKRFKMIAALDLSTIIASIATAALVAYLGGGVWALVAQQLVLYGAKLAGVFMLTPFRPGFCFDMKDAREHLMFGRDIVGYKTVIFFTNTAITFSIGKILGAMLLGFYNMAFLFVRLPYNIITGPLQFVLYGHLAPHQDDTALLRRMFIVLTRLLAGIIIPAMGMVAIAHGPFFDLLLSEKWGKAGELFLYAAPAGALQAVMGLRGTFLLGAGRSDIQFRIVFESFVVFMIFLAATVWINVEWVALGYSLAVLLYAPRDFMLARPFVYCSALEYIKLLAIPILLTLAGCALYTGIVDLLLPGDLASVGVAIVIGFLILCAGTLLQWKALREELSGLKADWARV